MKVALVAATDQPHQLSELRGIGRALARAGVDTTIVCADGPAPDPRDPACIYTGGGSRTFTVRAAAALRTIDPELVHVYGYRGCALLPYLVRRPRFVLDVRTGNVSGRSWARAADVVTRIEARAYDRVAVISRAVAAYVGGPGWSTAAVFPLGFPHDVAARARATTEASSPTRVIRLGYVGNLQPQRRLDPVLHAAAMIRDRGAAFRLTIVGDGGDRLRLETVARHLDLAQVVEFTGHVEGDAVWDCYGKLDVSIAYVPDVPHFRMQPSLKTLESMAAGLAVVATDTVGNREYIENGTNGLLVRDGPAALAGAIGDLIDDLQMRRRLGERAVASVARYSWDRIVDDFVLPAYRAVVGQRSHLR